MALFTFRCRIEHSPTLAIGNPIRAYNGIESTHRQSGGVCGNKRKIRGNMLLSDFLSDGGLNTAAVGALLAQRAVGARH
jgi:hypothetical protein